MVGATGQPTIRSRLVVRQYHADVSPVVHTFIMISSVQSIIPSIELKSLCCYLFKEYLIHRVVQVVIL
jgi:hypothetical protein